jgi:hypothetical protein
MREAEEEKLLRWKLENCYIQGKLEEAVRLGRRLDELQCKLLREAAEPAMAAG